MNTRPVFTDDSESLAHYGVMGMKWGVRNADTQRKYAGGNRVTKSILNSYRKQYKEKAVKSKGKTKKLKLTDNQKKAIKVGGTIAGAAVVAYGGYKLAEFAAIRKPSPLVDELLASTKQVAMKKDLDFATIAKMNAQRKAHIKATR